jgi:hypothetical protein
MTQRGLASRGVIVVIAGCLTMGGTCASPQLARDDSKCFEIVRQQTRLITALEQKIDQLGESAMAPRAYREGSRAERPEAGTEATVSKARWELEDPNDTSCSEKARLQAKLIDALEKRIQELEAEPGPKR